MRLVTHSMRHLPGGTWLLALGQALNLTAAVMMVTVAALAGAQLAPDAAWATLPYGVQFAAVMACTYPAASLMKRLGRRPVFLGSALLLVLAGSAGFLALETQSFPLLVAAHAGVGTYAACANFFRFAAVDGLPESSRASALSMVVAGGVLAALAGPAVATWLRQVPGFQDFAWVYGGLIGVGLTQLGLMLAWRPAHAMATQEGRAIPRIPVASDERSSGPTHPRIQLYSAMPAVILAMATAAGGYLVMNLLMIQTSLILKDLCSFDASSRAIQVHVLAMFLPSFLTGTLITRLGLRQVLAAGCVLLASAAALGIGPPAYGWNVAALVLLGLGWNLTYVGGSALLTHATPETQRHRWQGLHETLVAASATAGAFLPAPLLTHWGGSLTNGWVLVLCLAGLIACWKLLPSSREIAPMRAA